jgi:hypothetical protein
LPRSPDRWCRAPLEFSPILVCLLRPFQQYLGLARLQGQPRSTMTLCSERDLLGVDDPNIHSRRRHIPTRTALGRVST